MLKKYSLKALQLALNQALALDDSMPAKLEALHGKVIQVIISPLELSFFIRFHHHSMQLLDACEGHPDTIIHSSPMGLIRLSLLPASKARSLFNDKIRISGDLELGQHVKKLFDELDIDWEGHLAQFTGDVVAYQIGSFVRQGLSFTHKLQDSFRQNLSDYIHDELQLMPSRAELEVLYKDIDTIALDVERLQAHIQQLKKHHEKN